ncbi:GNAT family N-acetyltransferase [Sneathiella marina]|uniref:GNAT family N-acetyltransferase n=1 Tax=Sneathiella marina TaxID=2950108 RepID=A0ABY4WAH9_9PROT|nr:GNAT family N-acetyltransferase [Sneathiella marina]USG62284.1 GNAT family N-acetyltransferase [Sneathiella marina]
MSVIISEIEAHARAALPALDSEIYDGWQLRFANGHTRRANSVNFTGQSALPLDEKISHCEAIYRQKGQPCHFRLTPLANGDLDAELSSLGYSLSDPTDVLVQPLMAPPVSKEDVEVVVEKKASIEGINAIGHLTNLSPESRNTLGQMIDRSEHEILFAMVKNGSNTVAVGLGALSADYLGLFEFATSPDHRRLGYAAAIVNRLIVEAINAGAKTAYLQAVQSNIGGRHFWENMGFKTCLYSYHYRSKL